MKLIPKEDLDCEHAHFIRVNKFVKDYNSNDSRDDAFLSHPFSREEVDLAIRSPHKGI